MRSLRIAIETHVVRAIVHLPRLGGQGVLVPGGFVVTAAHCIGWTATGDMALGPDDYREEILAADGRRFTVTPYAVEPVSDVAVLGAVDGQRSPELADAFEDFCAKTKPVPLEIDELVHRKPVTAYVFTHDKRVIPARATQWGVESAMLSIEADGAIKGGTSGGPVVTSNGRLLGIISDSRRISRVHLAAPVWLVRQMVPRAPARLYAPSGGRPRLPVTRATGPAGFGDRTPRIEGRCTGRADAHGLSAATGWLPALHELSDQVRVFAVFLRNGQVVMGPKNPRHLRDWNLPVLSRLVRMVINGFKWAPRLDFPSKTARSMST
jgi:S1-C subfamily serine protease